MIHLPLFSPVVHTLFEMLGTFLGFRHFLHQRKQHGDDLTLIQRSILFAGCCVGALIGAKLVTWLDHPEATVAALKNGQWLALTQGKGIVGALIGGWICVELLKKIIRISQATGDLYVIPLIIGIGIGRIGCFLTGFHDQTYGIASQLPWAVDFGDGIFRHPTQIYEILFLVAFAWFTRIQRHTQKPQGLYFKQFIMSYLSFRLIIDFIKPIPHLYFGFSGTQLLALLALMIWCRHIPSLFTHHTQKDPWHE